MLQKIRKSIYSKILALYFAFNLLLPVAFFEVKAGPTTAGNTQFAPVSFGNLVDPFTGDFHYSIPLMEVPGPGGSYPIVLGYSSSSVNQEADAGWVGLGWNLNIGSITRETKGLPDDFKGDEITKTYHLKRSDHVTLDLGSDVLVLKELFGFKLLGLSGGIHFQLYNDSYTGFGMSFGLSASSGINLFAKTPFLKQTIGGSVGFNFDTQKGYSFSSGYGLNSSFYTIGKQKSLEVNSGSINNTLTGSFLGLTSFSKSLNKANYIPGETLPLAYTGANLSAQVGVSEAGTYNSLNIGIGQMTQDLSTSSETFEGAGYLYLNYAQGKEKCLMDYTRENDMPVNEESKTLANPILQADEYYVSGNDLNISFRPYRNDVGYLKPETRDNSYNLSGAGGEVGVDVVPANTDYKIGVDMTTTTGSLYTGPWQNNNFIDHLTFKNDEPQSSGSSANAHLEEHVYFKSTNDLTRSNTAFNTATGGYNASHFHLSLSLKQPKVANVNYETGLGTAQFASERVNRETYIQHWKVNEVETHEFTDGAFKIWTTAPAWDGDLDDFGAGNTFAYPSHALDHHIGKYKITTSDGMEYDYGLPVYNTKYYEVFYTTSTNGADPYVNTPKVGYNSTEASIANTSGLDHFYTKNSLGPHTTNHLLTGIRGHDYVDLKHDGITDDDLGYFMKFNYTRYYTNFKWRTPFYHSYYKKGKYTDEADNKATYVYGEKEVFYINSVESKTHIAVFILSDRTDGCEPAAEGNINPASSGGASSNKLKKLDKIILFNKSDDSKPLQTVEFTYDYSLYTGAESNSSATGRLTLTKVQVTFLDNNKGTTTPYEFEYNSTGSYSALAIDRWGVPATTDAIANMDWDNTENMFQVQGDYDKDGDVDATDASTLATNVSKGLLKKITLPSKGEMNIYYESDDYGYVQQYQAEQLVRIVGTSATNTETYSTSAPIMKGDLRIYFLLPEKIVDVGSDGNNDDGENANVLSYING
ncbi:MAG TPA: hypothetical protein VD905_02160, partial [Flavobacteriales bacterium]|nr:hypothetical protein [Flavobacteriales bacterium]